MTIRTAAAALCVAVLVGGCSADAEGPEPLPPVESASPSPVALPVPSEAAAETPEGAAAFARYYLEVMNRAFVQDDASQVRRVSHPECDACNNLIGAIEKDPTPGERIEGGDYEVIFVEAPPVEQGDVVVELRYALTEVRVFAEDGSVIRTTPAKPGIDAQMRLIRRGDGWIVRGFRNVQS